MNDKPQFTTTDYQCLKTAMKALSKRDFKIIVMRFWESMSIAEIAKSLRLSWDEVDASITTSLKQLEGACVSDPKFSRAKTGDTI